jgi:hypothetical protein
MLNPNDYSADAGIARLVAGGLDVRLASGETRAREEAPVLLDPDGAGGSDQETAPRPALPREFVIRGVIQRQQPS